jgi:hypothetical protein
MRRPEVTSGRSRRAAAPALRQALHCHTAACPRGNRPDLQSRRELVPSEFFQKRGGQSKVARSLSLKVVEGPGKPGGTINRSISWARALRIPLRHRAQQASCPSSDEATPGGPGDGSSWERAIWQRLTDGASLRVRPGPQIRPPSPLPDITRVMPELQLWQVAPLTDL